MCNIVGCEWKSIEGFANYKISRCGQIKSFAKSKSGRLRKTKTDELGYVKVVLSRNGTQFTASIHRLILTAFVGPCPIGMEACHNDGDTSNNAIDNLRWDTPRHNARDKATHGTQQRGEQVPTAKLTESDVTEIIELFLVKSSTEIASMFGVAASTIDSIKYGKHWNHRKRKVYAPRPIRQKLTTEAVIKIRQMVADGALQKEVADVFSVDRTVVSKIVNKRSYAQIDQQQTQCQHVS